MRVKRRGYRPDVDVIGAWLTFDDIASSKNSKPSEMKVFYIDNPWISNECTVPQPRAAGLHAPQPAVQAVQQVQEENSRPGCLKRCLGRLSDCFKKPKRD